MTNLPASIHQRLLNKAIEEDRPFNELLQYYAIERFLYRLGKSPYANQFILKGAFVFQAWKIPFIRPTRDIDFLGLMENSRDTLVEMVRQICIQPVEADGLAFNPSNVTGESIIETGLNRGIRIKFTGSLGKAIIYMQLDVGFGDVIFPSPIQSDLPGILINMPIPTVKAFPPETVIAEKFQAMVNLGMLNSRLKDYYDIWKIITTMEFNFQDLYRAITATFINRATDFPASVPPGLTIEFTAQKQMHWKTFITNNRIDDAPENMSELIILLAEFFHPFIYLSDIQQPVWRPKLGWSE